MVDERTIGGDDGDGQAPLADDLQALIAEADVAVDAVDDGVPAESDDEEEEADGPVEPVLAPWKMASGESESDGDQEPVQVASAQVNYGPSDDETEEDESTGEPDVDYVAWAAASDPVAERASHRDAHGKMVGETPLKYRMVFECDPPVKGNKKVVDPETGEVTNFIHRIELFGSNEMAFYLAEIALSRLAEPGQIKRMEAVILDEGSKAVWHDRNSGEAE